ncbi:MoaD/ThiS family protein [Echinimonas agarilytica]|uniref:Molybdopterin synthase sulfur carrier subunit n=1 Tax=Echinimonas agarilytica TaxID=1215918 RepID=A0AA42B8M6_9GAMM|nr:MoaD/ThiS family protein [Echinimonas agarilytica]MCM2681205.1 MoaD/ThiS family protein [Echinimonas agarilytica]
MKVLLFASLRESVGESAVEIDVVLPITAGDLKLQAGQQNSAIQKAVEDVTLLIAINQQVAGDDDMIQDGDEVAMFPPVTGG